jgi:hypothetical protein
MKSILLKDLAAKATEMVTSPIRVFVGMLGNAVDSRGVESDGYRCNGDRDFNQLAASVAQCSPAMAFDLIRQMDQYQALLQHFADLPAESY